MKNLVKCGTEPSLCQIRTYDEYQAESQQFVSAYPRNMSWHSKSALNSCSNTPRPKQALSVTRSLGETSISESSQDNHTPTPRKRQGSFAEVKSADIGMPDDDESAVEPRVKRQKSQEDCSNNPNPVAEVKNEPKESKKLTSCVGSRLFDVPDQWE